MNFPKYVQSNTRSLDTAIREAANPMMEWYDEKHDDLPFFANVVTDIGYNEPGFKHDFGNYHHTSWSAGHCANRWMESLYRSMLVGEKMDPLTYEKLKKWIFRIYDNGIGLPANLDLETFELKKESDICNLRESFYGLACVYLCERDPRTLEIARNVISVVDRYLDKQTGVWDDARYREETGAHAVGLFTGDWETTRFCNTFGRFVGGLTVFYQATGMQEALRLALELADIALRTDIREDGSFDLNRTASHVYSTSSMLSGIAFLAGLTKDQTLFRRLDAFMQNGYNDVALPCGWVCENLKSTTLRGEINDSCDLLEVCLELGKAGYSEYFTMAERMLRGHILPSQALDVCYISDAENEDSSKHRMASRVRGAFGFPSPYGHEESPGSLISFNWDIVGGVSGICRAKADAVTCMPDGLVSVNLLFDHKDPKLEVVSPYGNDDVLEVLTREYTALRVRLPKYTDVQKTLDNLKDADFEATVLGGWLYLTGIKAGQTMRIPLAFEEHIEHHTFLGHELAFRWRGEEVTGASSQGKRLCFFPEIDVHDIMK